MEVITYQLVIVATIWIAYRIKPAFGLWAAIGWSAETLILLFSPPLILIQLGVVWGTYFALNSSADLPGFFGPTFPRKRLVPGSLLKFSSHTPVA